MLRASVFLTREGIGVFVGQETRFRTNTPVHLVLRAVVDQQLRLLDAVVDGDSVLDVQSQHHPDELAERVGKRAAVVRVVLREAEVRVQDRQLHNALHRTLERTRAERHRIQRAAQRPNVHTAIDYGSSRTTAHHCSCRDAGRRVQAHDTPRCSASPRPPTPHSQPPPPP